MPTEYTELRDYFGNEIIHQNKTIHIYDINNNNLQDVLDDIESNSDALNEYAININNSLNEHKSDKSNPHSVTKAQVGLGNCDNTSDVNKPISTATQTALDNLTNNLNITKQNLEKELLDTKNELESNINTTKNDLETNITNHKNDKTNPHSVTKAQVGLENVPNVATNDQTPTFTEASSNTTLTSGEKLSVAFGKIAKAISSLISHLANTSNPHSVTKAQVGLGNCDNTSDVNKPISTATQTALDKKFDKTGGTITGDTTIQKNLNVTGNITGAKVYNAVWNADYAEGFDYEGEKPEVGDLVEIADYRQIRKAGICSKKIVGVVSDTYWVLAGCNTNDITYGRKIAVGLVGQVFINVIGPIEAGEYIISYGDGIGIGVNNSYFSVDLFGKIVGIALESNSDTKVKKVYCLLQSK